jgi:putative addiction module CopG family antidote
MSVVLSAELELQVRKKIESGLYSSAEDVLSAALRLLDEHDEENRMTDEAWESDGIGEGFDEEDSHVSMSP